MAKVFLVEDEREMIEDLRSKLVNLGHEVSGTAPSAAEAMNQPAISASDLVLLELKLNTSMKGKTANKAIQQRYQKPVVFVSRENRFDESTLKSVIEKVLKIYS